MLSFCEDANCFFKCKHGANGIKKNQCILHIGEAILFLKKFKVTTCEYGCNEVILKNRKDDLIHKKAMKLGMLWKNEQPLSGDRIRITKNKKEEKK